MLVLVEKEMWATAGWAGLREPINNVRKNRLRFFKCCCHKMLILCKLKNAYTWSIYVALGQLVAFNFMLHIGIWAPCSSSFTFSED
jgi:hypothetical protein